MVRILAVCLQQSKKLWLGGWVGGGLFQNVYNDKTNYYIFCDRLIGKHSKTQQQMKYTFV